MQQSRNQLPALQNRCRKAGAGSERGLVATSPRPRQDTSVPRREPCILQPEPSRSSSPGSAVGDAPGVPAGHGVGLSLHPPSPPPPITWVSAGWTRGWCPPSLASAAATSCHCHSLAPAEGGQSPSPWSLTCCSFHCPLPGCEAAGAMRDGGECSGIPADGGSTKALTTRGVSSALEQPQFLSQPGGKTTLVLPSLGQTQLWSFQAWFHATMKPHSLRSAASLLTLLPGRFSSSHQGRYVPVHFGEKGITQLHL